MIRFRSFNKFRILHPVQPLLVSLLLQKEAADLLEIAGVALRCSVPASVLVTGWHLSNWKERGLLLYV